MKDYKMEFVPVFGREIVFSKEYDTHEEAELALESISLYTLMLHDKKLMLDYSNMGFVFKRDFDGDWIEVNGDDDEF